MDVQTPPWSNLQGGEVTERAGFLHFEPRRFHPMINLSATRWTKIFLRHENNRLIARQAMGRQAMGRARYAHAPDESLTATNKDRSCPCRTLRPFDRGLS